MKIIAIIRAIMTNILAGVAPRLYMNLVNETGRGGDCDEIDDLENYCSHVCDDYKRMMRLACLTEDNLFKDKVILEYGPGDFLGVALLLVSKGAKKIYCVDRFPLAEKNAYTRLYEGMIEKLFSHDKDRKGWNSFLGSKIIYIASKNGLYDLPEKADIILSRAVLEHCNDLDKTFDNMKRNLSSDGVIIHKVDLTSHGTHYKEKLDFLCYPEFLWKIMTCYKGYPNRKRRSFYLELLEKFGFRILYNESRYEFLKNDLNSLRDSLNKKFKYLSEDDLLCSDYFFIAKN